MKPIEDNKSSQVATILRKVQRLCTTPPEYGSINLTIVYHDGEPCRLVVQREESELLSKTVFSAVHKQCTNNFS
jgi:hypothetical protein